MDDVLGGFAQSAVEDFFCRVEPDVLGRSGVHQGLENENGVLGSGVKLVKLVGASDSIGVDGSQVLAGFGGAEVVLKLSDWAVKSARNFVEGEAAG